MGSFHILFKFQQINRKKMNEKKNEFKLNEIKRINNKHLIIV